MKYNKKEKVAKNKYPSDFGSHLTMVNDEYIEFNSAKHGFIICTDARGSYVTKKNMLDSGLCDFNRTLNIESRIIKMREQLENLNE